MVNHIGRSAYSIIVLPTLSTLLVLLRFYIRKVSRISLRWDDYTIIASLPLSWACWGSYLYIAQFILGGELSDTVPAEKLTPLLKWIILSNIIYCVAVFIVKISVLLLFYRAFGTDRRRRIFIHFLLALNSVYFVMRFVSNFTGCTPIHNFWDHPEACPGRKFSQYYYSLFTEIFGMSSELALVLFPLPIVWQLRTSIWRKSGILAVSFLGGAAVATGGVRLFLLVKYWRNIKDLSLSATIPELEIINIVEINLGTIAICLMSIWAPLQKIVGDAIKRFRGTSAQVSRVSTGETPRPSSAKKDNYEITTIDLTATENKEDPDLEKQGQ